MLMKGFNLVWCNWIRDFIQDGSMAIRVNMSPMLFNIVAHMLTILIARAKEDDQVAGLISHLVEGGVSIL
jgi:hypothetical protein